MNWKLTAVTASILFSYLYNSATESVAVRTDADALTAAPVAVADTVTTSPTAEPDTIEGAGYTDLEDFVIVEHKKLVQSDGATLTYNVTEDPEAGSSNILEILRKVPGVTVDAEDNVKVNGQSSFKILKNGHEDPMLKGDLKTVLKSIPAASIKKIEVISEPGAKYEAEGVGGILNIVTDKNTDLSGFMTQVSAWLNSRHAGGYVNGRVKMNKVMLDATVNYNNGDIWPRYNTNTRETEDLTGGPNHLMRSDSRSKNGWNYTGANINMSWEPDTLNLFTFSGYCSNNNWNNKGSENRAMYGPDMATIWKLRRDYRSEGSYNGLGFSVSYQHTFGREDHTLVASYEYDYGWQRMKDDYRIETLEGTVSETPFSMNKENSGYGTHVLQIDYSNQLDKHNLLEAGAKINLNPSDSDKRPYFGSDYADAVVNENMRVDMRQFKDIYALYSSWSGSFDKWNVKAGVRYEHTRMGLKYRIGDYPDFTTRLDDVVPNAALSYNFTQASNLRMAYQMRISRPGLWSLNPYVNVLTPGQISYGNPDLESQKSHNVSLSYSNYEGKFSGSAKINYRYVANMVTDIIFMKDNILNSTYANVGKSHSFGAEINGDWNITSKLRWSLYFSTDYSYMRADSEMLKASNHGWQFYANSNINYTMPGKVRLSAYGGFYTPWLDLQSKGSENGYYYGLGASRSFLKDDALTLQLSLNNILPTHRSSGYTQSDESARITSHSRYSQWNVGFNISFRFGGLKANVKRTAANIEKEASGSQGGQGGNK